MKIHLILCCWALGNNLEEKVWQRREHGEKLRNPTHNKTQWRRVEICDMLGGKYVDKGMKRRNPFPNFKNSMAVRRRDCFEASWRTGKQNLRGRHSLCVTPGPYKAMENQSSYSHRAGAQTVRGRGRNSDRAASDRHDQVSNGVFIPSHNFTILRHSNSIRDKGDRV